MIETFAIQHPRSSGTVDVVFAADYRELLRWKSTHAPRIEALEGLLHAAQREAHAGREAIATLASERAANALLTEEVDRLRKQMAELDALARHEADCAEAYKAEAADLRQQLDDEQRQHDITRGELERTRLVRDEALRDLEQIQRSEYREAIGLA